MKSQPHRKRHLVVYFFLTFAISWGLIIILTGIGNFPIDPDTSQELLPLLYVSMLFGPGIAGILMIGLTGGKEGLRRLTSRLFRWRVKYWWYIIAFLGTPILASLILLILTYVSAEFQITLFRSENLPTLILNGILAGLMVGLFEEIGWSGFAIPRLTLRFNIFISGIIVGVIWGAWHFILFWERDSFAGIFPLLILLGRLFAWLPPFRILMVWIFNKTESLLLTIFTHLSLVFTTTVIVPMTLSGKALLTWIVIWSVVLWIVVFILRKVDRSLSLKSFG
jgi:membrane protease YdiL (CAAX protease family)